MLDHGTAPELPANPVSPRYSGMPCTTPAVVRHSIATYCHYRVSLIECRTWLTARCGDLTHSQRPLEHLPAETSNTPQADFWLWLLPITLLQPAAHCLSPTCVQAMKLDQPPADLAAYLSVTAFSFQHGLFVCLVLCFLRHIAWSE